MIEWMRRHNEAAAGPEAFEVALQSLRVAVQYHLLIAEEQTRDESMAKNTEWIIRRIEPDRRIRPDSYERYLSSAAVPRFVLDLRKLDTDSAESSWLAATRPFRFIGCCYDPDTAGDYWQPWPIVDWFDVMIHFESTRPTALLPFRFPDSW